MGCPDFAVLGDRVLQPLLAFIWFTDDVKRGIIAVGKPQDWLVMTGGRVAILRPSVFVVPDDLPSIHQPEFIKKRLQETRMMMDRVNEQIACGFQNTLGIDEPAFAPRQP